MVKVAFLGKQFPQQLQTNPEELQELQVCWVGEDVDAFRREVPKLGCKAAVMDIADVPELEPAALRELIAISGAELAIVTYGWATRAFLRDLRGDHIRVLQAPLTLTAVRAHLAFLVVQDLLQRNRVAAPASASNPRVGGPHGPRCTCADGVQRLIGDLVATEVRERGCAAREELGDRHKQLEGLTRQARVVLEDALLVARPPAELNSNHSLGRSR